MGRPRRNPFRGFADTLSEMNRAREQWMTAYDPGQEDRQRTHMTAWIPTTDIFAKGEDLIIRIEVAGVDQKDVDLTVSNGMLTVSGERRSELDEEDVNYYLRERFYGVFRRSMTLPEGIDEDKIDAVFRNGMLQVTIHGGAVAAQPRHLEIRDESD